jgi:putative oxidoreductase
MELGLLIIHGVVGLLFAGHGAQKLFGWFGGAGLDRAARAMGAVGWDVAGLWWGVASALVGLAGGMGVLGLRRRGSRASTAGTRPAPAA